MIRCVVFIAALALAGCGAAKAPSGSPPPSASGSAPAASTEIEELTDQRLIFECPKCGMMFSAAGTCTMDGDTLVTTRVDYLCPADNQPVTHAGQCPRCPMKARVQKTAMAVEVSPGRQ